jgi:hypothetical protein
MTRLILLALLTLATPALALAQGIAGNGGTGIAGNTSSSGGGCTSNCTFTGTTAFTGAVNLSYAAPQANFSIVNNNTTMNWPIGAAGGCCRPRYWSDTVNVTRNQAGVNVYEANFFNLILTGSGTLTFQFVQQGN